MPTYFKWWITFPYKFTHTAYTSQIVKTDVLGFHVLRTNTLARKLWQHFLSYLGTQSFKHTIQHNVLWWYLFWFSMLCTYNQWRQKSGTLLNPCEFFYCWHTIIASNVQKVLSPSVLWNARLMIGLRCFSLHLLLCRKSPDNVWNPMSFII